MMNEERKYEFPVSGECHAALKNGTIHICVDVNGAPYLLFSTNSNENAKKLAGPLRGLENIYSIAEKIKVNFGIEIKKDSDSVKITKNLYMCLTRMTDMRLIDVKQYETILAHTEAMKVIQSVANSEVTTTISNASANAGMFKHSPTTSPNSSRKKSMNDHEEKKAEVKNEERKEQETSTITTSCCFN